MRNDFSFESGCRIHCLLGSTASEFHAGGQLAMTSKTTFDFSIANCLDCLLDVILTDDGRTEESANEKDLVCEVRATALGTNHFDNPWKTFLPIEEAPDVIPA
jgi:hypothetical protein